MTALPVHADVLAAAERIRPCVHRTPVLTCATLDRLTGARLHFKCENLQKVGAFKFRGACNAVLSLPPGARSAGVATHSSGNHAAALALAARLQGLPAYIVMPDNAPRVKREAVAGYGGIIRLCAPTLAAREETLAQVVRETGAVFVHPYNDPRVIAGQGTAALELLAEVPDLDTLVAPVGGGGLLSGTALAAEGAAPDARIVGAEPAGADDACRSLREGRIVPSVAPRTMADGLLTSLGELTFAIIRRRVEQIATVSEPGIAAAMRLIWERMKLVVEPTSAVPLAALLEGGVDVAGRRVGIILSGGNVELGKLPWRD
ncbi:MAG: pyridoxal-phosphate dependent enzyme [Candidatus Krumholzibacteriia bacterium]